MNLPSQAAVLTELQATLFNPFAGHGGLKFLARPDWVWKPVPAPRIKAHAAASYPGPRAQIERDVEWLNTHTARHAVMYNQSLVQIDSAQVRDGITIEGRSLAMLRRKPRIWALNRRVMAEYLATAVTADAGSWPMVDHAPQSLADLGADAVFRVPGPGIGNYFHGVWEILPQLMPAQQQGFKGRIVLHITNRELAPFVQGHLELVYPDLVDQIEFQRVRPEDAETGADVFDDFHTGFDWSFYALLAGGDPVDIGLPDSVRSNAPDMYDLTQPMTFMFNNANSYTVHQKAYRDAAVAAVAHMDTSHLPRRFWISRKGSTRRPEMPGEADLLTQLRPMGFEEIRLETLTPAEQVALFQNAEIAMGQHGAGMTNMAFASPDTTVIEIGHGKTTQRWRTFHQMTAASGCRHESFFCDYDTDDPDKTPNMKLDGFPTPAMTPDAVEKITACVDKLVSRAS